MIPKNKKWLCVGLLWLLAVVPARAQNWVVTFTDQNNVYVGTYTGPLGPMNGVATNGFVLNPYGDPQIFAATSLQPCALSVFTSGTYTRMQCSNYPILLNIYMRDSGAIGSGSLPVPGTYDINGSTLCNDTGACEYLYRATVAPAIPTYSCSGFQAPFDQPLSLKHKTQRAIPLIMQLKDANGNIVTDQTIAGGAAPVVNVTYSGVLGTGIDETALLDPIGQSSAGNSFVYDPTTQTWQFNLSSAMFSATGTYTVTVVTGDGTQYSISPTCSGTFVRQ